MTPKQRVLSRIALFALPLCLALALFAGPLNGTLFPSRQTVRAAGSINQTFTQASQQYGVPVELLQGLCYMEGHFSNHGGSPSIDGGYGCMHLVKNNYHIALPRGAGKDRGIGTNMLQNGSVDTLDSAATDLGVTTTQLKTDMATNISGGAAILRDDALQLSGTHTLPTTLADWYGAVAAYSNATTQSAAHLYADALYKLLNAGFSGTTDTGEVITVAPVSVQPNTTTIARMKVTSTLPQGCIDDGKTDYPGAINCIVDPATFDCNLVSDTAPCTYLSADRPNDLPINFVGIHDIEGSALNGINTFQDVNSSVSIHYIVDVDGTVYQMLHEKDVAFHIGNFWYNQRSIGIEHAGFDATGFLWYNATQYLASAKLVAYLTKKYHISVDHDHIFSHGMIPSPSLATSPNHVDPGPYWLWDYYFQLIAQQGAVSPNVLCDSHIISLHPSTGKRPLGHGGTETAANFNFFYLYTGPSTKSGLIAPANAASDITDETIDVETDLSYYYVAKAKDPAGTGDTMYEIWYGTQPQSRNSPPDFTAHGQLVWLAVPSSAVRTGSMGTPVELTTSDGSAVKIYGRPTTSATNVIGDAPNQAIFVSRFTVTEDGTSNLWYEINYNHRQAWVPATEVTTSFTPKG